MAVMIVVVRDPVEPPSRHRPGLPSDLERIILRCLAKSPEERYPDVAALDHELAGCAAAGEWSFDRAAAWWKAQGGMTARCRGG